jgi:hypothetical protein
MLACGRRQLADDSPGITSTRRIERPEELFGKLPKRTGWQPYAPQKLSRTAGTREFLSRVHITISTWRYGGVGRGCGVGRGLGVTLGVTKLNLPIRVTKLKLLVEG